MKKNTMQQCLPLALPTILYCIQYQKTGVIWVITLSDVLDKTSLAAQQLEKFVNAELLKLPWFQVIWDRSTHHKHYYDAGRHFYSEEFLAYSLIERPKKTKRDTTVQIFVGHHGKTKLDGVAFGNAGVGGAMKAIMKQQRLLTTEQFCDFCEQWKAEQQSKLSQKERDLNRCAYS